MLWVYGLGQRDLSACLPGDIKCVGKERTYTLAGIEEKDKIEQLIVSRITYNGFHLNSIYIANREITKPEKASSTGILLGI